MNNNKTIIAKSINILKGFSLTSNCLLQKLLVLTILSRYSLILYSSILIEFHESKTIESFIFFILSYSVLILISIKVLFFRGINYLLIGVNFCVVYLDLYFLSETLGTTVASMCCISLCKFNDGKFDKSCKYFAFFGYAVSSFGALFFHLNDELWLNGETLVYLFQSSYLCRFSDIFLIAYSEYPNIFTYFSIAGVCFHSLFQVIMPFSLFNKYAFLYIKYWGWLFFVTCFVFIELSYLPILEIILWISLFYGKNKICLFTSLRKCFSRSSLLLSVFTISSMFLYYSIFFPYKNYKNWIYIYHLYKMIGFESPNVFNSVDLEMSNHWSTISRARLDSCDVPNSMDIQSLIFHQVPVTKPNGSKDFYQYSDLIYQYHLGTCSYRRQLNSLDLDSIIQYHLEDNSFPLQVHQFLSLFDYKYNGFKSSYIYRIDVYKKNFLKSNPKIILTRYLILHDGMFYNCSSKYIDI